jgi:hypothetical protein
MRYTDLPDLFDKSDVRPHSMACPSCGDGPYSADRGDYFWADPSATVTCRACGGEMALVWVQTVWEFEGFEVDQLPETTVLRCTLGEDAELGTNADVEDFMAHGFEPYDQDEDDVGMDWRRDG